jgi:Zn-dependent membrane protease YugP
MIVIAVVSFIVQMRFKSKFKQYSEMPLMSGLSGRDVAERMLRDNGIYDVRVISVEGQLTDHYNPTDKTVNLSPDVYHSRSVAAAAVAAHECGHAVQHAKAYSWLSLRSTLVPVVNVASTLTQWTLMIGIMLLFFTHNPYVLAIGVGALALVTLFSLIVPVRCNQVKLGDLYVKYGIIQQAFHLVFAFHAAHICFKVTARYIFVRIARLNNRLQAYYTFAFYFALGSV